jgi:hypothetical protein
LLLSHFHVSAQAENQASKLLPENAERMAIELLELVNEEFATGKKRTVSSEQYATHPYWVAVFALGNSVAPDVLETLQKRRELTVLENLALGAAQCTSNRERLESLIRRYRVEFDQMPPPHQGGAVERKLLPEHVTPDYRVFWEILLLSPRIDQLSVGRCMRALSQCGTIMTFRVLRLGKIRMLMGDEDTREWREDISSLKRRAGGGAGWASVVGKIDPGGESALREILYILETIEMDYPGIVSLKRFHESPFYHPDMKGVTEYFLELRFLERTDSGEWLWKEAFEKIDTNTLTPRGSEIVKMMRERFK